MILKTTALTLRFYPYGETSRVVLWLTRDFGKIATLAKGSQRHRSAFLGQYDLFYTCEILFYGREQRHLHILKECAPIESRTLLRQDWRACAMASYLADLAAQVTPFDSPHPDLFDFFAKAWDWTQTPPPAAWSLVLWLELRLLDHLGLRPVLQHCAQCRKTLPVDPRTSICFSAARGGVLCAACAPGSQHVRLSPAAWNLLQGLQQQAAPDLAGGRMDQPPLGEPAAIIGEFLRHHLEARLPSRDRAYEIAAAP